MIHKFVIEKAEFNGNKLLRHRQAVRLLLVG